MRRCPRSPTSGTPSRTSSRTPPGFIPDDPGRGGAGSWQRMQWNFLGPPGSTRPTRGATDRRRASPAGAASRWRVLDTGVAYRRPRRFRRSPDFVGTRFVPGYDFVDRDAFPNDQNGHGTFVAGVIAESDATTASALTGLAYGATIMPVRVLDEQGRGRRGGHRRGHPLRRPARREGDQPLPGVRLDGARLADPRAARRDPRRHAARRARRRRLGQRGRAASPTRPAPTA